MKIRPLHDRIVVKRTEQEEKTAGGIILPGNAKEKPQEGEVLAIGDGKYIDGKLQPLSVKVGDKVIFGSYAGNTVKIDGEEVLIMNESEVFGILDK